MRVIVLAAVVILVGCGTDERDRPEPPAASTRAAGTDFLQRCAREAASATVTVLCPTRLPISGFEKPRNYGDAPCSYLLNLEPRGLRKRAGTVFHVLFGGTCRPWNLQTRDGRWPARLTAARPREDVRLIGATTLLPGQAEADRKRVALRVLRHARVGAAPALVLRNPPYPTGGIHGGHISVVWNANGVGYVVTGHAVATPERPDSTPGPRALRRASDTLLAVAAAMRRAPA